MGKGIDAAGAKRAADQAKDVADDAADKVQASPAYRAMVRVGLLAYGLVHLLTAWLALQLAFGDKGEELSKSGALRELAQAPMGGVLLWTVAAGLLIICLWQVIMAVTGREEYDGWEKIRKRLSSAGRAIVYGALGSQAAKVAMGAGSSSSGESEQGITATIMGWPLGWLLVVLVGLAIIAVGVAHVVKGVQDKFTEDLASHPGRSAIWSGRIGYVAKGLATGLIGVLFCFAGFQADSSEAGGMDQALSQLIQWPGGPWLLGAMALGFLAYGVFCFFWSKQPKFS